MKRFSLLIAASVLLGFAACNNGDDDTPDLAAAIAGTYIGYTNANSSMFTDRIADGAVMTITANPNGTAKIVCATTDTFGTITADNITVTGTDGAYVVSGSGTADLGMDPASTSSYPFTVTGSIKSKEDAKVIFTMNLGNVMGETTFEFITGAAPVVPPTNADAIAGLYNGYLKTNDDAITEDVRTVIVANADGTINITSNLSNWGDYELENIEVVKSGDVYTFSGEGSVSIDFDGGSTPSEEYHFTLEGSVKSKTDASITYTVVIGGETGTVVLQFIAGAAPTVTEQLAGTYNGYTVIKAGPAGTSTNPDETVTITANGDGTVNISYTNDTWGEYVVSNVAVTEEENVRKVSGTGTVSVGMDPSNPSDYDFTLEGSIVSKSNAEFKISVPQVMGMTIEFFTGNAPE